jgi:hypothetical protein
MNTYCTYLTIYQGNKLPPFYIGFSTVDNVNGGYHGSVLSKRYKDIWLRELKHHSELFQTKILTTHDTLKDAQERERSFQRAMNVVKNPLYINMAIGRYYDNTGFTPWNKGRKASPEECEKNRIAKLGNKWCTGHKHTPESIEKMRQAKLGNKFALGRKHTPAAIEKIRQARLRII